MGALCYTGLVTFIAFYHYRIFHSFNDAYRYMDWLLTVPLLLIEIVLVMKLSPEETKKQSLRLGVLSGLMILNGYPGEKEEEEEEEEEEPEARITCPSLLRFDARTVRKTMCRHQLSSPQSALAAAAPGFHLVRSRAVGLLECYSC